jgi:hypothetical protein
VREFDDKWLRGAALPVSRWWGAPTFSPRRPGEQFRSGADHAHGARDEGDGPATHHVHAGALLPLGLTMMPLDQLLKTLLGVLF